DTAETLCQLLKSHGHDARFALSARETVGCLDRFCPDALILDIMLPDMDGYAVANELCRALGRKPLLIGISGLGNLECRSTREGFDYHFVKPVDGLLLLAALRDHAGAAS